MAQKTIFVDDSELREVLETLGKAQAELVYRLRNLHAAREIETDPGASLSQYSRGSGTAPHWFSPLLSAAANDVGGLEPGQDGCAEALAWHFFETTPIRSIRELETDLRNLMKARHVVTKMLSQP